MALPDEACMTSPTAPILDGIADFPRRTTTLGETWREMADNKPMEIPRWLGVVVPIVTLALTLLAYAFGAGSKSQALDQISAQVTAMALKVDAVNTSVTKMESHADTEDERFRNVNTQLRDLLDQQRVLSEKVERLEMAK